MWMKVDETALDDWRIALLAQRMDATYELALLVCMRVWKRLYDRGGGPMHPDEIDAAGRRAGLGILMAECGLAESSLEGLRIRGDERAKGIAKHRVTQQDKALEMWRQRRAADNSDAAALPGHSQSISPGEAVFTLSSLRSDPDPESGSGSVVPIRDPFRDARASAEAWVEWFNRRFGRQMRVHQELVRTVKGLLSRGFSEKPDMRGVALYLKAQWSDDEKMRGHLVPSTILRPTKFAERLDLARDWDPSIWEPKEASNG